MLCARFALAQALGVKAANTAAPVAAHGTAAKNAKKKNWDHEHRELCDGRATWKAVREIAIVYGLPERCVVNIILWARE